MSEPVILVCGPMTSPLMFPDNLVGPCAECGDMLQFRPHAPRPHILRCMRCAADLIEPDDE